MLVYVFSFLDRQIMSMMVGDLKEGLGLEKDWQVGFLMGPAFAVFYTIFGIPFGRLADTHSRKHIIALGLAVWSLMTAGCGVARGFTQMALLRVGVGIGEASLSPLRTRSSPIISSHRSSPGRSPSTRVGSISARGSPT